eukprot:scaffold83776_cov22-Cyclotella_meneghiniana.AAC.1
MQRYNVLVEAMNVTSRTATLGDGKWEAVNQFSRSPDTQSSGVLCVWITDREVPPEQRHIGDCGETNSVTLGIVERTASPSQSINRPNRSS